MSNTEASGRQNRPVEALVGRETGWLVERHDNGSIRYLRIDNNGVGYAWVSDSLNACRFARRVDAEMAAEGGELHDLRIVEHMWVTPNAQVKRRA